MLEKDLISVLLVHGMSSEPHLSGLCLLLGVGPLGGDRLGLRGSKGPAAHAFEQIMKPI